MKTLSVVVPVYYNEQSLPNLFEKMLDVERRLGELGLGLELIFVDDGSQDDSWKVLLSLKERRPATRLIKLSRNFGAVEASKAGYRYVTGDCFVTVAADLQDPPEVIIEMARHWLAGSKFVISERARREDPLLSRSFPERPAFRVFEVAVPADAEAPPLVSGATVSAPRGRRATDAVAS